MNWLRTLRRFFCDLLSGAGRANRRRIGFFASLSLVAGSLIWMSPRVPAAQMTTATAAPVTLNGILNSDSDDTLALTPDGNTVFFDRSEGPHKTIMISHRVEGRWSPPQIASFSGHWFDQDPLVAPDGSYLLFDSDRPTEPGGQPLTQSYFAGGKGPGSNIWRVNRSGDRWGSPVWLGPTVNNDVFIDFASVAGDGALYFIRWNAQEKAMHIWRSQVENGRYLTPELVTIGDPSVSVHDPAVAPDQSFMVLDYGKVKGGLGRLCIAFREGDHWGKPIDFGDSLNRDLPWGSHLSPDGHSVYVTGQSGIRQISLDPWLKAHQNAELSGRTHATR
ncbi:MAG TPA: hypothetical protein VHX13_05570 [Acidobacteriaceae bacterium]|nr:hypothetical protein [Acidobacteriaceae bacterium]